MCIVREEGVYSVDYYDELSDNTPNQKDAIYDHIKTEKRKIWEADQHYKTQANITLTIQTMK